LWGEDITARKRRILMAKITNEMVHEFYEIGKRIYIGDINRQEGLNILNDEFRMNSTSAMNYIHNYKYMMNGEKYSMTMNEYATKYYLTKILLDNGQKQLEIALESVRKHIEYQNVYNNMVNIKELYNKYSEIVNGNCSKIISKVFELL
jgi:5-methylcytosine-specific restriction protein A